ncbi:MAG: M28 family peptidase [Flavobacteriales bacterium]|nr:M28 family peptidase [Flavobacteriales bacterium]
MNRIGRLALTVLLPLALVTCKPDAPEGGTTPPTVQPELPPTPEFNADSAYVLVEKQVAFGPRVPGTAAHRACADWLVQRLRAAGADTVIEQTGTVTIYNGNKLPLRNLIASWNVQARDRILLFAHYDTRPFADKDKERMNQPIDGANDGGSGVGVLLEIARHLAGKTHGPGVDILFTDVEDHGQPSGAIGGVDENSSDTWCLGARYWAKNPHVPDYKARFGILLDMVGARDARFYKEAFSMRQAGHIVNKVWRTAAAIGHGDRFVDEVKFFVGIDDHVPVHDIRGVPAIDIIEYDPRTNAFGPYWHTHADNMEVIDRETLRAVGRTVLEVVWKER